MAENPYESPRTYQERAARDPLRDSRQFKSGIRMIAFAVVLPFVAWLAGHGFVAFVATSDPVPQGAMLFAFLGLLASLVVAAVLFVAGVILAIANRPR